MARSMVPRDYFRDEADVYTRATGGQYTVLARAALPCRVDALSLATAPTGPARTELAARRQFQWAPDYTLPAFSQLLADGVRWNIANANAPVPVRAPISGDTIALQVELVRAA